MPMIEVSDEEYERRAQLAQLGRIMDAEREGDFAVAAELEKEWAPPPRVLLAAKRALGAEWVKAQRFDTRRADREYGPGWLEA